MKRIRRIALLLFCALVALAGGLWLWYRYVRWMMQSIEAQYRYGRVGIGFVVGASRREATHCGHDRDAIETDGVTHWCGECEKEARDG
jgi:hypothetical protein